MPFPKCKTVQENPKTPTRTTRSTQVKLRLLAPASSCMEGNFIAMAISNISEFLFSNNLFRVTVWRLKSSEPYHFHILDKQLTAGSVWSASLRCEPGFLCRLEFDPKSQILWPPKASRQAARSMAERRTSSEAKTAYLPTRMIWP